MGNVLVTISDNRVPVDDGTYEALLQCPTCLPGYPCIPCHYVYVKTNPATDGVVDRYTAVVITANDYYPFGMLMPGRKYSSDGSYRYGFNGKENDNDVKGEGNQQDYGLRIYDPRLGKFLSVDPLTDYFPWYSPYHYAGNTPIQAVDLDGAEPKGYHFNHPYVASHPGSGVQFLQSDQDGLVFDDRDLGIVTAYTIQDVDEKLYVIFESATGAKKNYWYREYDKDGWKGNVNSFTWSTPPDASEALTAFIFIPMVALPGAVAVGTTTAGTYILKELTEEAFEQVTGIPLILDPLDIVERAVKGAYKDAAVKELKNFFKQNINESVDEIRKRLTKAIKSHEKEILQHENLIKDPKKYMKEYGKGDWDKLDPRQQKALVEKEWVRHKERHEAMKAAKEETLKDIKQ